MAGTMDRAKDWWEGKAPRERTLLMALAAALVVCLLAWVANTIRHGLDNLDNKNQLTRSALTALEQHRVNQASSAAQSPHVTLPPTPVALDTYLESIVKELSLESPTYPEPKVVDRDGGSEESFHVSFQALTIYQLKDLLEKIETRSPVVIVTDLHVKKSFRDPEKVNVDLTVATYFKKSGSSDGESGGGKG